MKRMRLTGLALAVFFLTACSSLLYHPTQRTYFDPKEKDLRYEDVWLKTPDGVKIHGWYFVSDPERRPKAVITFFHGNGENLTSHFASLAWILPFHYDYFIFDYRGYGDSEGTPSPENTVQDGILALKYVRDRAGKIPQVVYAQSLGGAVAMRAIAESKGQIPLKLVVIDSGFISYEEAGRRVLSHHFLTWLFQPLAWIVLSDRWAPEGHVREIAPIPLVVMHGDRDQIIDFCQGEELFKAAGEPKEFWKIESGRHTDAFWLHKNIYKEKLLRRLDEALKAKLQG